MSAFTISRNRVSYHVSFPLSYYYCFTWFYTRNKKRLDHKRWTHRRSHHSTHAFSTRSKTYDTQTYASAGVRGDRRGTNVKLTPRINDVIIDRRSKARGSKRATCVQSVWNGIRETFGTKKPLFPLNHEFLRADDDLSFIFVEGARRYTIDRDASSAPRILRCESFARSRGFDSCR